MCTGQPNHNHSSETVQQPAAQPQTRVLGNRRPPSHEARVKGGYASAARNQRNSNGQFVKRQPQTAGV